MPSLCDAVALGKCLYVHTLPSGTTREQIMRKFTPFGRVIRINLYPTRCAPAPAHMLWQRRDSSQRGRKERKRLARRLGIVGKRTKAKLGELCTSSGSRNETRTPAPVSCRNYAFVMFTARSEAEEARSRLTAAGDAGAQMRWEHAGGGCWRPAQSFTNCGNLFHSTRH